MPAQTVDYEFLTRTHPDLDLAAIELTRKLYSGTIRPMDVCEKHPYEPSDIYKHNLSNSLYENDFWGIISNIITKIFEDSLLLKSDNADTQTYLDRLQKKVSIKEIGSKLAANNLLYDRAFLRLSPPAPEYSNLLQEEASGQDLPDVAVVPNWEVINWRKNPDGSFRELVLRQLLQDETVSCFTRESTFVRITHYERIGDTVIERVWETKRFDASENKAWRDPEPSQLNQGGTLGMVANILFGGSKQPSFDLRSEVPIETILPFTEIPVYEVSFEIPLHLGPNLVPYAKKIYQLETSLMGGLHRGNNPLPWYGAAPSIRADSLDDVAMDAKDKNPLTEFRNKGLMTASSDSTFEFKSPSMESVKISQTIVNELKDKMFFAAAQSVNFVKKNSTVGIESLGAKEIDDQQRRILISYICSSIKEDIILMVTRICAIYGVDADDLSVDGLDYSSDSTDKASLVAEAQLVGIMPAVVQSPTFASEYGERIAAALLDDMAPPETMQKIRDELEKSIADQQNRAAEMHAATVTSLTNPAPAEDKKPAFGGKA